MNVLVVGSGGREHALAWKISQSPKVNTVYCAPGNPGMAQVAECVDMGANEFRRLAAFAKGHNVGLVVVGPEDPLAKGIVDLFAAEGLTVFGPSAAAAQLEGSKSFAKRLMAKYDIPTAAYAEFTDPEEAIAYIRKQGAPIVIKADGLAAGKGVTVAHDVDTAVAAVRAAMSDRVFGDAGEKVIVEECLVGEEASILAFTDGKTVLPLAHSQDHKPVNDGDTGPNTGGMGAYSPAPVITPELFKVIECTILRPCVDGMAQDGTPYRGLLYAGLMITESGPKVIEFNCRFGDPETQVVLPRMKSDIMPAFLACCDGTLDKIQLNWTDSACVTVVMASGGYPGPYAKGKIITGTEIADSDPRVTVFHAGTKQADAGLVTNGGRILNVTAMAPDIAAAIEKAYDAVAKIHFDGAHYRTDIGKKALDRLEGGA